MDLSCRQNRLAEGEIGGGVGYFLDNGGFVELKSLSTLLASASRL